MGAEQRILAELSQRIENREWEIGQRLPPERKLAEILEASRGTVRAALRLLTARGVLDIRRGSGCYLRSLKGAIPCRTSADPNPLDEGQQRLEACYLFFPSVAALCARRITPEGIARLEQCATGLSRAIFKQNIDAIREQTAVFMRILARGTGNTAIIETVEVLCAQTAPLVRFIFASLDNAERDEVFADYVRAMQAMKNHDPAEARARMEERVLRLSLLLEKYHKIACSAFVREEMSRVRIAP